MATQSSLTRIYDDLFATTGENLGTSMQDNVYESNTTVAKYNAEGAIEFYDGGTELHETLTTAENDTFASYAAGGIFDTSEQSQFSRAIYQRRFNGGTISWNREDEDANSGAEQRIDFVAKRMEVGFNQGKQLLNKQLLHIGAKASTTEIDGIPLSILATAATDIAYGGFNGSTDLFWQNKSVTSAATTFAGIVNELLNLSVQCDFGASGPPDMYLADPTSWQQLASYLQNAVRVGDKLSANLGFPSIEYRGMLLFYDRMVPDAVNDINFPTTLTNGSIYALNTKAG